MVWIGGLRIPSRATRKLQTQTAKLNVGKGARFLATKTARLKQQVYHLGTGTHSCHGFPTDNLGTRPRNVKVFQNVRYFLHVCWLWGKWQESGTCRCFRLQTFQQILNPRLQVSIYPGQNMPQKQADQPFKPEERFKPVKPVLRK